MRFVEFRDLKSCKGLKPCNFTAYWLSSTYALVPRVVGCTVAMHLSRMFGCTVAMPLSRVLAVLK